MSDQDQKFLVSRRLHNTQKHIDKQLCIAKTSGIEVAQPHRYHKMHALNCGDAKCMWCANPRRVWKEDTLQEKSFAQTEKWITDEEDTI